MAFSSTDPLASKTDTALDGFDCSYLAELGITDKETAQKGESQQVYQNFSKLLEDQIITYVVGVEEKQINVHLSAMKLISEPLARMVTIDMRESKEKKATLVEDDAEAFVHLVEYAYKGPCALLTGVVNADLPEPAVENAPAFFKCLYCGATVHQPGDYPFCKARCHSLGIGHIQTALGNHGSAHLWCVVPYCTKSITCFTLANAWVCDDHNYPRAMHEEYRTIDLSNARTPVDRRGGCSSNFIDLKFGSKALPHAAITKYFNTMRNLTGPAWPLLRNAQVYILCKKYMVHTLREVALFKLHHHLCQLEINESTVEDIVQLVKYAYASTDTGGNIIERNSVDPLRGLVMAFLVDRRATLRTFDAFVTGIIADVETEYTGDYLKLLLQRN